MTGSNPWLKHVKETRTANPNLSYKEALIQAKKTYKGKQSGGNPAALAALSKGADLGGQALGFAGQIAEQVQTRREKSGFYDAEARRRAVNEFNKLRWQRDRAILPRNKIPKSWSDAKLMKLSGLDKFI